MVDAEIAGRKKLLTSIVHPLVRIPVQLHTRTAVQLLTTAATNIKATASGNSLCLMLSFYNNVMLH